MTQPTTLPAAAVTQGRAGPDGGPATRDSATGTKPQASTQTGHPIVAPCQCAFANRRDNGKMSHPKILEEGKQQVAH